MPKAGDVSTEDTILLPRAISTSQSLPALSPGVRRSKLRARLPGVSRPTDDIQQWHAQPEWKTQKERHAHSGLDSQEGRPLTHDGRALHPRQGAAMGGLPVKAWTNLSTTDWPTAIWPSWTSPRPSGVGNNYRLQAPDQSALIASLRARVVQLQTKVGADTDYLKAKVIRDRRTIEGLQRALSDANSQLATANVEINELIGELAEAQVSAAKNKKLRWRSTAANADYTAQVEGEREATEDTLRASQRALASARAELDVRARRLEEQAAEIASLTAKLASRDSELAAANAELARREQTIDELRPYPKMAAELRGWLAVQAVAYSTELKTVEVESMQRQHDAIRHMMAGRTVAACLTLDLEAVEMECRTLETTVSELQTRLDDAEQRAARREHEEDHSATPSASKHQRGSASPPGSPLRKRAASATRLQAAARGRLTRSSTVRRLALAFTVDAAGGVSLTTVWPTDSNLPSFTASSAKRAASAPLRIAAPLADGAPTAASLEAASSWLAAKLRAVGRVHVATRQVQAVARGMIARKHADRLSIALTVDDAGAVSIATVWPPTSVPSVEEPSLVTPVETAPLPGSLDTWPPESQQVLDAATVALLDAFKTEEGYAELKALFATLDKDGNGSVSSKEWGKAVSKNRELLSKYFGGASAKEVGMAFRRLDVDGSGELSWDEFEAGAERLSLAMSSAAAMTAGPTTAREATVVDGAGASELATTSIEAVPGAAHMPERISLSCDVDGAGSVSIGISPLPTEQPGSSDVNGAPRSMDQPSAAPPSAGSADSVSSPGPAPAPAPGLVASTTETLSIRAASTTTTSESPDSGPADIGAQPNAGKVGALTLSCDVDDAGQVSLSPVLNALPTASTAHAVEEDVVPFPAFVLEEMAPTATESAPVCTEQVASAAAPEAVANVEPEVTPTSPEASQSLQISLSCDVDDSGRISLSSPLFTAPVPFPTSPEASQSLQISLSCDVDDSGRISLSSPLFAAPIPFPLAEPDKVAATATVGLEVTPRATATILCDVDDLGQASLSIVLQE